MSTTEVVNFNSKEVNNVLCNIPPAKFDLFLKILEIITKDKTADIIDIQDSVINQNLFNATMVVNLKTAVFDDNNVSFHILNPSKYIPLLKIINRKNRDVFIIDDNKNSNFVVTNGEIQILFPKRLDSYTVFKIEEIFKDVQESSLISELDIGEDEYKDIRDLGKKANYIEFLIHNGELKGLSIPDTALYTFDRYVGTENIKNLNNFADIKLRSSGFTSIPVVDKYNLKFLLYKNGYYHLTVEFKINDIDIWLLEQLEHSNTNVPII